MKARVVFCRSNPIAPDPRVTKAAHALSDAGYSVTLIGWSRSGILCSEDHVVDLPCQRLLIKAPFGKGLNNLWGLLRWQWGLLYWLYMHRADFDIIHACDFDTVLPALVCKRLFGKLVVYDIFDFYADHLRATPNWIKSIIRGVDLKVINWVDAVILADDSRWEQIAGAKPCLSAVIYNTPVDQIYAYDVEQISDQPDILRLVYVGLLQIERGLLDLLSLMRNHPTWHLDLAGFGGDQEIILDLASEMPNVRWHGRITYQRALALSHSANVFWALYDPVISNHHYASPNKLFEAMMLGIPIIVAKHTQIDNIVAREQCGFVVDYGDLPALDKALTQLQRDPQLRKNQGENGRQAYDHHYNWELMKARLLNLYAQL